MNVQCTNCENGRVYDPSDRSVSWQCEECRGNGSIRAGGESAEVEPVEPDTEKSASPDSPAPSNESGASEYALVEAKEPWGALAPGIYVYLGTTGIGKTHLAWNQALETHKLEKRNLLVIDAGGAENFSAMPHARDLREAIMGGWSSSPTITIFTPKEDEDFEKLMRACRDVGNVILFLDEISLYATSEGFKTICRLWRHCKLTIIVTCQHVGSDLGQALLACNPTIKVFRTTSPRSLEWLERWHDLPPSEVRSFPSRNYVQVTF